MKQMSSDNMLLYIAGSFCVVMSPAHLTFNSMRCLTTLLWNQRVGRWRLFAARPTFNATIRASGRRDCRSLYCNGCSPCRSGGGSGGGEADNWGVEPVATRDPAAAARLSCVLGEMMLTSSSSVTFIDIYHCRRIDPHLSCVNVVVLAMDDPD